jgi:hypothetical protein
MKELPLGMNRLKDEEECRHQWAEIRRAMMKGAPKWLRRKKECREEEERPGAFVHGSMGRAKLNGVAGCASSFGMTRDTWRLLYGPLDHATCSDRTSHAAISSVRGSTWCHII